MLCAVRVILWHWHVWYSSLREYYIDARFYLVSPMCDLYLERYIGVSCTGLYVKLEVFWEVHSPLAYTLTVSLRFKNQIQVRDRRPANCRRTKANEQKDKRRTTRPWRIYNFLVLFFIEGRIEVVQWGPVESQCVDCYLRLHFSNALFLKRGFAIEPEYFIWLWALTFPLTHSIITSR